jgi:dinuclear metal center YbgI/SA1388 family protein
MTNTASRVTVRDVTAYLETIAPLPLQESYDNAGLIVGDGAMPVTGILVCLDSTEAVIDEAVRHGCNLVVAHHPIVFSGLKKINGRNYVERTVMKALRHEVAIYATHTNLDNVSSGVNDRLCERLALVNRRILLPKKSLLKKLVTFCPVEHAPAVRQALFGAGAGRIGRYDECSFNAEGTGTFRAGEGTDPFVGRAGEQHHEKELRIEVIFEAYLEPVLLQALQDAHPYEEVAYDVYSLENSWADTGAGMIGETALPVAEAAFLRFIKEKTGAGVVRHTALLGREVRKVAVCGGSGSFLLSEAIRQGADVLVTADFKYHQFFDADGRIVIADIGHYESEQFTQDLLHDLIRKKFPTFALRLTEVNTNPVHYL